jgi:hypothetical protein
VAVNQQNQKGPRKDNKTGFLGVCMLSSAPKKNPHLRYKAQIKYGGSIHVLGLFATAEEAGFAYLAAKREHHPGNTL